MAPSCKFASAAKIFIIVGVLLGTGHFQNVIATWTEDSDRIAEYGWLQEKDTKSNVMITTEEGNTTEDVNTPPVESTTPDEESTTPDEESTTPDEESTTPEDPGIGLPLIEIQLDWNKYPEMHKHINGSYAYRFTKSSNSPSNHRIAIHLKSCVFDETDSITITDPSGTNEWTCKSSKLYNTKETPETRHTGHRYVTVLEYKDNLNEVTIIPRFSSENDKGWENVAAIVVNIYKDIPNGGQCGDDSFDCHASTCGDRCCSDENGDSSKSKQTSKTSKYNSLRGASQSRCIPWALRCNNRPNCGMRDNMDEHNEVCHENIYCECRSVCLSWNYVLTSLAIAILFIITPTAVVFALFHRRNVALERARLIRLAQGREFTRESPADDLPPTYDDVYDIKVPPPCFCKAIAMEKGVDQVEGNLNENETENTSYGIDNSGFDCSCKHENVESLPSYADVEQNEESKSGNIVISSSDRNESSDFDVDK